jgi:hypothetical protein
LSRSAAYASLIVGVAAAITILVGYRNATAEPLIRRLNLSVPDYPAEAPPLRIVLFSDVHVHGPDMPPKRVSRIVDQINALDPDVVIAAGDFVGDNWIGSSYPLDQAIAPLGRLKARLGVYAVLGNNDYSAGATEVANALERARIRVLVDDAVRVGPIALGGRDGRLYSGHASWSAARSKAFEALRSASGIKVLVAHRPDEFAFVPAQTALVLAGHTHCGQIVLPIVGALETGSDFGQKYLCGVVRDGSKTLVVTAGVGTSYVPIRFGAPPDIWLITLK